MIEISDIVSGYTREIDIIKNVSLHVDRGEIVTLLGPNGCGKSTLLKTIAGVLIPRAGSVVLDGQPCEKVPVHRKISEYDLGLVPQNDNVFTNLTVRENLQVGGSSLRRAACRARIEQLCGHYPILREKYHDRASSMSGGQRQILALARALMPSPRVLLLDEPSAGLAPKILREVFDAIVQIRDEEGVTVLMVEQNAMEALRMSDRAYILSMGTVALEGPTQDLLADPQVRELYLGGRV